MKARRWLGLVALTLAACGGRQNLLQPPDDTEADAATPSKLGPVDFSQAPTTLPMTCDHGIGAVAFDNPCLVGQNLAGGGNAVGFHEVECTLATPSHPITWAFLLPLAQIVANPDKVLSFPSDVVSASPTSGQVVAVGGRTAGVSGVAGTVTFSRVDGPGRAFVARLEGTFTWTESTGATFSCAVDAPFWGAPGAFE